ncbi:MAG: tRNA (adenosine(37)-N6)-dimethylallyltransferase MiaA [Coriobacteriales bacterium]|jgi:tRNA dimethylallyltransferase
MQVDRDIFKKNLDSLAEDIASRTGGFEPRTVLAIVGPTGTGKSYLAERVARILEEQDAMPAVEIVSADSMQVYRGMDIGTAKVPAEKRSVPYHCIDLVDPGEAYSASIYQRDAREAIEKVFSLGKLPIVCGGTGLYVRAALDVMDFPPGDQVENPVRAKYTAIAEEKGPEYVHSLLEQVDPESASLIHPNNVRRTIRAFEMLSEGRHYSDQVSGMKTFNPFYDTVYIGLTMETDTLYASIDNRVDEMMEAGLLDEVSGLVDRGFADAITSSQAIGYKEFIDVFEGKSTIDEAVESIKRSTRRYSKRQRTWFRRDPRIEWYQVD